MAIAPDNLDPAIRNAIAKQSSMGGTAREEYLDPAIRNAIANAATTPATGPNASPFSPTQLAQLDPAIRNAIMGAIQRGEYTTASTVVTSPIDTTGDTTGGGTTGGMTGGGTTSGSGMLFEPPTTTTTTPTTTTPTTTTPTTTAPTTTTPTTTTIGMSPERQSIFDVLNTRLSQYGLSTLAPVLKQLITDGATEDTITIRLQETPEYKTRFIANEERIKKGLRVLSPSEYIAIEDAYRQVLRTYGLRQFDNDAYVSQFIANDVSAAELSDRVSMAVQRVQNADPAISRTLRDYYGISQADMVAYVLDPNQQLQKIQRQIAAAEIGTAARLQGIEAGVTVSEQLAAQGISQAQAQKGYSTIADILPTAEKLSQIYGATMEGYDLAQAEQEVFNQLASAQRRRERLTQREVAAFSGESGLGRTALTQQAGGQF